MGLHESTAMSSGLEGARGVTVWTVGHSTRSFDEFRSLLKENRIEFLVDVRHFPTSRRAPWATKAALLAALPPHGIGYEHAEALGGFRKAVPNSVNAGWRTPGFRGYADYMATPAFEAAIERLIASAAPRRTAIMCAEAVPWKCHRSLVSDSLVVRGVRVIHILGAGKTQDHRLTSFARVRGLKVTYPASRKGA
jgi:uncharacterized protein (DUF488 family)